MRSEPTAMRSPRGARTAARHQGGETLVLLRLRGGRAIAQRTLLSRSALAPIILALALLAFHCSNAAIFYQVATYGQQPCGIAPPVEVRTANDTTYRVCEAFYGDFLCASREGQKALGAANQSEAYTILATWNRSASAIVRGLGNCLDGKRVVSCYDSSVGVPPGSRTPNNFPTDAKGTYVVSQIWTSAYTFDVTQRCCGRPAVTLLRRASPVCAPLAQNKSSNASTPTTFLVPSISPQHSPPTGANVSFNLTHGYLECGPDNGYGIFKYCVDRFCANCPLQQNLIQNRCDGPPGAYQKQFCLKVGDAGKSNVGFLDPYTADCAVDSGAAVSSTGLQQPVDNTKRVAGPWIGFGDLQKQRGWTN